MEMTMLRIDEDPEEGRASSPWLQANGKSDRLKTKWPPMIWFIMKVTGLFYHRILVTKRWCIACEADNYTSALSSHQMVIRQTELTKDSVDLTSHFEDKRLDTELNVLSPPQQRLCKACETCWWDRYGRVSMYTEADIGLKPWNHRGSRLVSVAILLLLASLISFEFFFIKNKLFAKREFILNLLSYIHFLCPLLVFPVMNICSKATSVLSGRGLGLWATSLNARYIVQRLQYLDLPKYGLPSKWFLAMCIVWPICCTTYRAYITVSLEGHMEIEHHLNCLTVGISQLMWGCFVYLLFLIRLSFQIQLELVLDFLKLQESDEALCQRVVQRLTVDFRCFSDCVAVYMAAMIPLCVLSASTSLTLQYLILEKIEDGCSSLWCETERSINTMIWIDFLMFSSLGPLAIGGFNVNYIWKNFLLHVQFMQNKSHQKLWGRLVRFLEHTEEKDSYFSFATFLSLVSLYIAIISTNKGYNMNTDTFI